MKKHRLLRFLALTLTLVLLLPLLPTAAGAESTEEEYDIQIIVSSAQTHSRSDETPIGKYIKDKFNIVFEYLPVNDNSEKQSLMLATGDYPEIIRLEGGDMVQDYIDADALVCLDDYIASSTNFKTRYAEQIPYWRASSKDGKIYTWNRYVPADLTNVPDVLDIGVRTDMLEQQGWPNLVSVCADTGGAGASKTIVALSKRMEGISMAPKPTDVAHSQRLVNDDFRSGRAKLRPDGLVATGAKSCLKGKHEADSESPTLF